MRFFRQLSRTILLFLLVSDVTGVRGQQQKGQADQEPIKLSSTLVQVPVIVSDKGGRYITDLSVKDFQLYEDGKVQEITFFGSIEEPFSVALLLDSSGSTVDQLEKIKEAAMAFIESLRPSDRVLIMSFNDSVQIQCELTGDRDRLKRAIRAIRPGEYTQVFEAVYTAVWEKLTKISGRKAVILFTDGIDTASSEIVEEDTLDAVIESEDVIIYPIRYGTRRDVEKRLLDSGKYPTPQLQAKQEELNKAYQAADEYLRKLADLSGGLVERADELKDLKVAFSNIASELRQQYLIGYYPSDLTGSDNERKLRVRVNREGAKVRTRPGYSLNKQ
jgi:Ca-activated chloride channel homolog